MTDFKVILEGFKEAEDMFNAASIRYEKERDKVLKEFGKEAVEWFQAQVRSDAFGLAPKVVPNGEPPLIDVGNYINSYKARILRGGKLAVGPMGRNRYGGPLNQELGEILEAGRGGGIPRKHLDKLLEYAESKRDEIGERIINAVLRGPRRRSR